MKLSIKITALCMNMRTMDWPEKIICVAVSDNFKISFKLISHSQYHGIHCCTAFGSVQKAKETH